MRKLRPRIQVSVLHYYPKAHMIPFLVTFSFMVHSWMNSLDLNGHMQLMLAEGGRRE